MGLILDSIRTIPDFPIKGVQFRDITTLLKDPIAMVATVDEISESLRGINCDFIMGPE